MLTLTVDCSNHQQKRTAPRQMEITLDRIDDYTAKQVKAGLEAQGWIVQFNDNMDTYCSRECAT